ncbi:hypothetical protein PR003_g18633 [Phytophthora rubi]|uniref:Secreted protein n=1 Tax=Phytophthora rubi TaxID=129364 RepID=A0A6A4E5W1_9STRA|nr:hypothetical protein PR002_g18668 [Phytophthora rubi]KAE9316793.1 hypothetical protein PR003_g18633 [Phytophthora rubi]
MPVRSLSILCTAMSTAAYYILCRTTRRSASCDSTTCSGSQIIVCVQLRLVRSAQCLCMVEKTTSKHVNNTSHPVLGKLASSSSTSSASLIVASSFVRDVAWPPRGRTQGAHRNGFILLTFAVQRCLSSGILAAHILSLL